jgi:hypothetical protein
MDCLFICFNLRLELGYHLLAHLFNSRCFLNFLQQLGLNLILFLFKIRIQLLYFLNLICKLIAFYFLVFKLRGKFRDYAVFLLNFIFEFHFNLRNVLLENNNKLIFLNDEILHARKLCPIEILLT